MICVLCIDNMLIVIMYKQYVAIYGDVLLYICNVTYSLTHASCVTIYRPTKSFNNDQHMIFVSKLW